MAMDDYSLEIVKAAAEGMGKESINKIAAAIGTLFPFWGAKRQAVNAYISDIQNSNLSPEVKMLAIVNVKKTYKQLENQYTIAQIAQDTAKEGTDFSASSGVDDEWLERFMDSAKFVSDEKVQTLWGNVLSKEFEAPNSTPPSVIRILTEITPMYAKAFQVLCSLYITIAKVGSDGKIASQERRIIVPDQYEYLNKYGISFSVLTELEMLGLIQYNSLTGYILKLDSSQYPKIHLIYGQDIVTVLKYEDKSFPAGVVLLTQAGLSLSRFTESVNVDDHFKTVIDYLKSNRVEFSDLPEKQI